MDLIKELDKIIQNGFFKKNEKMVVGVSGGVDSMSLLFSLNNLKDRYNFHIIVAHLNHGLRKEADKDEFFVKDWAEKNFLNFISKKVKLTSKNMEEKAREERYAFFEEIKTKENANSIVTAHNANDQIETVILNLTRGSGLKGLAGMDFKGRIKRPFLNIKREEIEKFVKKNKISWREDKTNKDMKYSRNRVRHNVITELEKINPKVVDNVLRMTKNIAEYSHFLQRLADKELQKIAKITESSIEIDVKKLKNKDSFILKEVVLRAVYRMSPKSVEKVHVDSIVKLLDTKGSKEISLPLGLKVEKIYDNLLISLKEKSNVRETGKKALKEELKWNGQYIFNVLSADPKTTKNKNTAYLKKNTGNLWIRSKKEGDFLFLEEAGKKKKISDIFIDAKVPKKKRDNYPMLVNEKDEVLWVPGLRVNAKYASKQEKDIIKVRFKEINEK